METDELWDLALEELGRICERTPKAADAIAIIGMMQMIYTGNYTAQGLFIEKKKRK